MQKPKQFPFGASGSQSNGKSLNKSALPNRNAPLVRSYPQASQVKNQPAAPQVQPRTVLNNRPGANPAGHRPATARTSALVLPKMKEPVAPPRFVPETKPKVIQNINQKFAGVAQPKSGRPAASRPHPAPPPPANVTLSRAAVQAKMPKAPRPAIATAQMRTPPAAPPVYKPIPHRTGNPAQMKPAVSLPKIKLQQFAKAIQRKQAHAALVRSILSKGRIRNSVLMPSVIQRMTMALPNPPLNRSRNFIHSGQFQDMSGNQKQRAGRVEAILDPNNAYQGSPPSVDPLGWDYANHVALQKPNKPFKPHRGWVRFHLLNEELGGPGNTVLNLVPTLGIYNTGKLWRDFEEAAKYYADNYFVAFEVQVAYHANVVSNPQQLGDNQLQFFPQTISGEFQYYKNGGWRSSNKSTVTLNIPAPSVTPGFVEVPMTDCSEQTLTGTFSINSWLAKRIVENQNYIYTSRNQIATVQDLYDLLYDMVTVRGGGSNDPQGDLNATWGGLQTALNKTAGTALRIYPGWAPNGTTAIKRYEISLSTIQINLNNQPKLAQFANWLGIDISVLKLFGNAGTYTNSTSFLYFDLTRYMQLNQAQAFDNLWPKVEQAVQRKHGWCLTGIKFAPLTKTRTQELQEQAERWRREQEEKNRREEEERKRQEALRLQRQKKEDEDRQLRDVQAKIRYKFWSDLQQAVSDVKSGQQLSQQALEEYRQQSDKFINGLYHHVKSKMELGNFDSSVDLMTYYQVNVKLNEMLSNAKRHYPWQQPRINPVQQQQPTVNNQFQTQQYTVHNPYQQQHTTNYPYQFQMQQNYYQYPQQQQMVNNPFQMNQQTIIHLLPQIQQVDDRLLVHLKRV